MNFLCVTAIFLAVSRLTINPITTHLSESFCFFLKNGLCLSMTLMIISLMNVSITIVSTLNLFVDFFKSQFIRDNAPNKIFKLHNGMLSQFKHSWFCYVIKSYSITHYIDVFLLSHTSEKRADVAASSRRLAPHLRSTTFV